MTKKEYQKKWYLARKKDPEFRKKRIANTIRYFQTKRGKRAKLNAALKCQFGLSLSEFEIMVESQNGLCAICGEKPRAFRKGHRPIKRLIPDHDHKTGKVRGLLCSTCNLALGGFRDSVILLKAAVGYLERHT